jgi:sec-independent protein translocase protein TatB
MFDFAWSEIALIGVVALVLIGPKDLPVAMKGVANVVKKARRMAAEFQSHVDEMVRDTELAEVRKQIDEIRNFDIRGEFERAVDEDGSLRRAFEEPLITPAPTPVPELMPAGDGAEAALASPEETAVTTLPEPDITAAAQPSVARGTQTEAMPPAAEEAPEFIPPAVAAAAAAPDFIPPQAAQGGTLRPPFA